MQLWRFRRKSVAGCLTIFSANSLKKEVYTFFWKRFPQKRSSAQVQSIFQFLAKNMLLSGRKIFANVRKQFIKRTFSSQHFSSKMIPRTVGMHVFITATDVFSKNPKGVKKLINFKKVFVPQKATLEKMQFSLLHRKFFSITPEQFRSRSGKLTKLSFFQFKNCSLIMILRTGRIKFWQPCGNFFAWRPTFFSSKSKPTEEFMNFPREISCPKGSFWHVECIDDNLAANTWWKIINFPKNPEIIIKLWTFKDVFPSKTSPGHLECSFYKPAENFCWNAEKY